MSDTSEPVPLYGAPPLPDGPLPAYGAPPAPAPPVPAEQHAGSVLLGKLLFAGGALTMPIAAGVVIGFWVADRDVRWLVTLRWLIGLLGVGLLTMILGGYRMGPAVGSPRGRKRIALSALLLLAAAVAWLVVGSLGEPSALTAMSKAELRRTVAQDADEYRALEKALAQVTATLAAKSPLFPASGTAPDPSADEEALLVDSWETFFHGAMALDRIRRFHEDYYRFDLSRGERELHVQSYLLTFASELALYARTLELTELLGRNPSVVKLLQEARPERRIPADSWALVREDLGGISDLGRVMAGKGYWRWLCTVNDAGEEAAAHGLGWLVRDVERHLATIELRRAGDLAARTMGADLAPISQELRRKVYPTQSKVAEYMGDTRFRRPVGKYLITKEQLDALAPQLRPGDVMLGRKNWYLSNIGLPGFWPHALLWVGDDAQLRAAFDQDPEVRAWIKAQSGLDLGFVEYMARTYPQAWADRAHAAAEEPLVIVEAVSEGVLQSAFGHASGDYLAALRPKLSPLVKARAIARAFGWLGRPYDFEFDFATDTTLVCSEVVWRAYRPQDGLPGLEIPLIDVLGRRTLPPHEIARLYAQEKGGPRQQFEFVAFLEGSEAKLAAVVSDEQAFLATPKRSKWDFRQE